MSAEPMMENVMASARMVVFMAATRVAEADCWAAVTAALDDWIAAEALASMY